MLNRQYGIAAPPFVMPVTQPEDSQPNERIHGRSRNMPPRVANTVRPPRFDRNLSIPGQPFSQYATRGSGSWRGRRPGQRASSGRQEMQSLTHNQRNSREDYGSHHPSTRASFRTRNVSEGPSGRIEGHPRTEMSGSTASQYLPPTWTEYRSPSPKLPPDPLRRRTPLNHVTPVQPPKSSRPPLPGRKRRVDESFPEILLPPAQKLKVEATPSIFVDGFLSHKPIPTTSVHIDRTPPPHHPHTPPPVIVIKDEPSSPELIFPSRKLVTAACKFWPTPNNCRKSVPNYADNRLAFAKEQSLALSKLGLKKTKVFFREDGMVIEWKSEVPVWNDTLLPEVPRPATSSVGIRRQGARRRDLPGVIDVDALPSPTMSPKRKRNSPEIIDVDALPTPVITPKKPRINQSADSEVSSAKGGELAGMATLSTRKAKVRHTTHWATGLSKADRRNLGKCDQNTETTTRETVMMRDGDDSGRKLPRPPSSHPNPKPTPDSASTPCRSGVGRNTSTDFIFGSPMKRPALPTRLHRQRADITSILTSMERRGFQLPSTQPRSQQSEANVTLVSTPSNHDRRPGTSSDRMNEDDGDGDDVLSRTNAEKSTLGVVGSNDDDVVGDDVYSLVDRLLSGNHVSGSSNDEQHEGEKGSAEPIVRKGKSREGSVQGDFPEYEMAKEFVRRFIHYFDSDRTQLEMAYSKDALFSCRNHRSRDGMTTVDDPSSTGSDDTSNSIAKPICQGRAHVAHALSSLENYSFSPRGVPSKTVYYDLAALPRKVVSGYEASDEDDDDDAVGIVLATVHSDFVKMDSEDENLDRTWTLNQSFVLRRRIERDDDVNGDTSDPSLRSLAKDLWPLVAISHQMVLMDNPLLPSDEILPST